MFSQMTSPCYPAFNIITDNSALSRGCHPLVSQVFHDFPGRWEPCSGMSATNFPIEFRSLTTTVKEVTGKLLSGCQCGPLQPFPAKNRRTIAGLAQTFGLKIQDLQICCRNTGDTQWAIKQNFVTLTGFLKPSHCEMPQSYRRSCQACNSPNNTQFLVLAVLSREINGSRNCQNCRVNVFH